MVASNPQAALQDLQDALGPDMVPAEYGGPCTLDYTDYPAERALVKFHEGLKAAAAAAAPKAQGD